MKLLKCTIQGFKSFADQTVFEFGDGISAIVGPNGSGKSNVLDAIKWVLGEQSTKALRGNRMDDFIFTGTTTRAPLGMAAVTLELDNSDGMLHSDYAKVVITRRLFRSGQSEYLINGQPCRLKDIVDTFLSTGVGRNTYAFIGQGQIDNILNARPEELRILFEETAGVSRYKARRQETVQQLEVTQNNLTRVDDVVSELELGLDTLCQEAERAQQYQSLLEEDKHLAKDLLTNQYAKLSHSLDKKRLEIKDMEDALVALETSITTYRAQEKDLFFVLEQKNEAIREAEKDNIKREGRFTQTQERLVALKERLSEMLGERTALESELTRTKEDIYATEQVIEQKTQALADLDDDYSENLAKLTARMEQQVILKDALSDATEAQAIEQFRACEINYQVLVEKKTRLQQEREQMRLTLGKHRERYIALEEEHRHLEEKRVSLNQRLNACISQLDQTNIQRQSIAKKVVEEEKALDSQHRTVQEAEGQLQHLTSEHRALSNLVQNLLGFKAGVRIVLQGKQTGDKHCDGVVGVIADLLYADPSIQVAMEAILGSALQSVVTKSSKATEGVIAYLKKHRGSRTTFLPLDDIKGYYRPLPTAFKDAPGIIGHAVDLVQFESHIQPAITHLLGQVVVVKDVPAALNFRRKLPQHRLVTLTGEVFNTTGAITAGSGGSAKGNGSGILGRRQQLLKLNKGLQQAKKAVSTEREQLAYRNKTLATLKGEYQDIEDERQQHLADLAQLEQTLALLRQQLQTHHREMEHVQVSLDDTQQILAKNAEALAAHHQEQAKLLQDIDDLKKRVDNIQSQNQDKADELAQIEQEVVELKLSITRLEEATKFLVVQINEQQQTQQNLALKLDVLQCRWNQQEEKIKRQEETIKAEQVLSITIKKEQARGSAIIHEMRAEHTLLVNQIATFEEQRQRATEELGCMERKRQEVVVDIAKEETKVRQIEAELLQSFAIYDLNDIGATILSPKDTQIKVKRRDHIKDVLDTLEGVDVSSITEYRRRKERIAFLVKQRHDLAEAREKLLHVVKEIDILCAGKLEQTLDAIDKAFSKVHRQLFKGGHAQLRLTDTHDILSTGVSIVVQLPGKKIKQLSLLSGGEKSLTAIALLFAIFLVKPAPFCVLDEIDSALDEANNILLANYLLRIADKTQCLIITHSKQTMQVADTLYGITMEEKGVSRVVSLSMEKSQGADE